MKDSKTVLKNGNFFNNFKPNKLIFEIGPDKFFSSRFFGYPLNKY